MNRYLKHKKQEEEALKRKLNKEKEIKRKIILKIRLMKVWVCLKEYLTNYVEVKSPYSKDLYLVEKGKEDLITFETKPEGSLRFSNHWDWLDRRNDYIQCEVESSYLSQTNVKRRPKEMLQISMFMNNRYYTFAGEIIGKNGGTLILIPKKKRDIIEKFEKFLRNQRKGS